MYHMLNLPWEYQHLSDNCVCLFACVYQHLMCAGLWCLVEGDASCKTKLDPPLDGTECGADKVRLNTQIFTSLRQQLLIEDACWLALIWMWSAFEIILFCVCVSGAGQASVSVRLRSLSMWMVTGVNGASGACAAGPAVLESSSDRGNVTTLRMSPVCLFVCWALGV